MNQPQTQPPIPPPALRSFPAKTVASLLLTWFADHARDLPWRREPSPYRVTVSEFMLQQTQVNTVLPYFHRWITRFPHWAALAAAREQAVLSEWEGLGYYSRARNLHRIAQIVTEAFDGRLPSCPTTLRALPGIGDYAAGAIASFAFELPEPAVDTNVARVLVRLLDWHAPVDQPSTMANLRQFARQWIPTGKARAFNGALMELGATVCLPRQPLCLTCPVHSLCRARHPELLPRKEPRKKTVHLHEQCWFVTRDNQIALVQNHHTRRWNGLWSLPPRSHAGPGWIAETSFPFTHHQIRLRIYPGNPADLSPEAIFVDQAALPHYPIPAPHRRIVDRLLPTIHPPE